MCTERDHRTLIRHHTVCWRGYQLSKVFIFWKHRLIAKRRNSCLLSLWSQQTLAGRLKRDGGRQGLQWTKLQMNGVLTLSQERPQWRATWLMLRLGLPTLGHRRCDRGHPEGSSVVTIVHGRPLISPQKARETAGVHLGLHASVGTESRVTARGEGQLPTVSVPLIHTSQSGH